MFDAIKESISKWKATRKERRIEKLTARAADLKEDQAYDLLFLHKKGFVRARASGQSITQIYGEVESLIRKKLQIAIKPGTYFVARGGHQNMVTRREYTFTLYPCSTEHVAIKASCINAGLPIPKEEDVFYGVKRVPKNVARFLESTQHADPMVVQAGVWALTDNYSGHTIQSRLVTRDRDGNTRQAVSDRHIEEARQILDELGISHNL